MGCGTVEPGFAVMVMLVKASLFPLVLWVLQNLTFLAMYCMHETCAKIILLQ
jgi:hypothetical protein